MILRKRISKMIIYLFLAIVAMIHSVPLLVMLLNTLRTDRQIKVMPLSIPETWEWGNYTATWIAGGYGSAYLNSIFVSIFTILIGTTIVLLAAYSVTRLELPKKGLITGYFILGFSFPAFLYIIPTYFMFSRIGLVDNLWGLIFLYSAGHIPLNFVMVRAYLLGIPKSLDEASYCDGCTPLTTIWYIILPLARPIITTVALLIFVRVWNEFVFANTFIQTDALRMVATRFVRFTGEWSSDLSRIYTAAAISAGPIIIIYLFLQQKFIDGMTQGGIKG